MTEKREDRWLFLVNITLFIASVACLWVSLGFALDANRNVDTARMLNHYSSVRERQNAIQSLELLLIKEDLLKRMNCT
jgi:hypothetical protein